jgi:hypothetical protein
MVPPGGSAVSASMPAAASAAALANAAWPLAWPSSTGLSGDTAFSESLRGTPSTASSGTLSHLS